MFVQNVAVLEKALNINFVQAQGTYVKPLDKIAEKAANLENCYPDDVENLESKCGHLRSFLHSLFSEPPASCFYCERRLVEVYPNVLIAIRIVLCTMVTNCSAERSLSVLKLLKNVRRSERLVPH